MYSLSNVQIWRRMLRNLEFPIRKQEHEQVPQQCPPSAYGACNRNAGHLRGERLPGHTRSGSRTTGPDTNNWLILKNHPLPGLRSLLAGERVYRIHYRLSPRAMRQTCWRQGNPIPGPIKWTEQSKVQNCPEWGQHSVTTAVASVRRALVSCREQFQASSFCP